MEGQEREPVEIWGVRPLPRDTKLAKIVRTQATTTANVDLTHDRPPEPSTFLGLNQTQWTALGVVVAVATILIASLVIQLREPAQDNPELSVVTEIHASSQRPITTTISNPTRLSLECSLIFEGAEGVTVEDHFFIGPADVLTIQTAALSPGEYERHLSCFDANSVVTQTSAVLEVNLETVNIS
ncbi:MAG: hypothetical protein AAF962_03185 [Actinomycetota bacterium]